MFLQNRVLYGHRQQQFLLIKRNELQISTLHRIRNFIFFNAN